MHSKTPKVTNPNIKNLTEISTGLALNLKKLINLHPQLAIALILKETHRSIKNGPMKGPKVSNMKQCY
jgi:hypothetical protein